MFALTHVAPQNYWLVLQVFHEVAYKAHNRDHLVAGLDEFLDLVTSNIPEHA